MTVSLMQYKSAAEIDIYSQLRSPWTSQDGTVPSFLYLDFDSPRLDLTVFGLRPNKSKSIRQKNLKKIKFYHVGLVNILLNSHKAVKLTIS
jgi:hypothetical protein